ncbi:MAG TPA: PqqD family protein [Vicinamibacterales bacterium]|jgi:hypothetical protein
MNHPQRVKDYRIEQLDDELLLYHPGRTTTLYCNDTAALIWQLCDGTRTVDEIVDLLTEQYPEEPVAEDVGLTLEAFEEHGAISYV